MARGPRQREDALDPAFRLSGEVLAALCRVVVALEMPRAHLSHLGFQDHWCWWAPEVGLYCCVVAMRGSFGKLMRRMTWPPQRKMVG